jgi:hypothetical protein
VPSIHVYQIRHFRVATGRRWPHTPNSVATPHVRGRGPARARRADRKTVVDRAAGTRIFPPFSSLVTLSIPKRGLLPGRSHPEGRIDVLIPHPIRTNNNWEQLARESWIELHGPAPMQPCACRERPADKQRRRG